MYNPSEIYLKFRSAQSQFFGRPYKIPNDLDIFVKTKLTNKNRECLELITGYFNTKFRNIEPDRYFQYGFNLFGKSFSYVKFFDKRLFDYYVMKDKIQKRDTDLSKQLLVKSAKFVLMWMKNQAQSPQVSLISQYCWLKDDGIKAPIRHFQLGYIDKYFLSMLILYGFIILDNDDRYLVPLISERYREYVFDLNNMRGFVNQLMEKLK